MTGLLDFEVVGAGFRVQDVLAALYNSAALPELLIARSLGSVLWRAARWRAGLGLFGEVTAHAPRLEATVRWLAANEAAFLSVVAAANAG